nr:hypothetical protein [uncultured Tolumonas sp.]
MFNIQINHRADLDEIAIKRMKEWGFVWNVKSHVSPFLQLLNISFKQIDITPRNVIESSVFTCPKDCIDGYKQLTNHILMGKNINIYLSSGSIDGGFNDGFLNHFGLYHFHLGTIIQRRGKSKNFIQRTKYIAVAYVTPEAIYMIDIRPHAPDLWIDKSLVEVIHNEWPDLISKYKIQNAITSGKTFSTDELHAIRHHSYNLLISMPDGTLYSPTGAGVSLCGTNSDITLYCLRIHKCIKCYLNLIKSEYYTENKDLTHPIRLKVIAVTPMSLGVIDLKNNQYHLATYNNSDIKTIDVFTYKFNNNLDAFNENKITSHLNSILQRKMLPIDYSS